MALGCPSVDKMLAGMSQREFREWQGFWNISPFGEDVNDERAARAIALQANLNRKKGAKPFTSADFMLQQYKKDVDKANALAILDSMM